MIGFDRYSLNQNLLFCAKFEEGAGPITQDWAKANRELTLHGALTWGTEPTGLSVLDFITNGFLDCPAADTTDLNFTDSKFSMAAWIKLDHCAEAALHTLMDRATANGGWFWEVIGESGDLTGHLRFTTRVAAGTEDMSVGSAASLQRGEWHLVGVSRDGTSVRLYVDGVDVTDTADSHTNPTGVTAELHLGVSYGEAINDFDGRMWEPRIWNRALPAVDHKLIYDTEVHYFVCSTTSTSTTSSTSTSTTSSTTTSTTTTTTLYSTLTSTTTSTSTSTSTTITTSTTTSTSTSSTTTTSTSSSTTTTTTLTSTSTTTSTTTTTSTSTSTSTTITTSTSTSTTSTTTLVLDGC